MAKKRGNRAIFHHRDSSGRHDQTAAKYVEWVQTECKRLGLLFSGSASTINRMIESGEAVNGDIFLDYDFPGNDIARPALTALLQRIATDIEVSHVFIPLRDRLVRPRDAEDGLKLENGIRRAGITVHFQDRVLSPLGVGQSADIGEQIGSLIEYNNAGKFRRDLARRMIEAQRNLAENGFSTGGSPPFFLERWLVDLTGQAVRLLPAGEVVRKKGFHVAWLPKTDGSLELALRIVEMVETLPASRVARILTLEGIPSPNAGRVRKDNGVEHLVSGVWHQTTIINTVTSMCLVGQMVYGRRSMGDQMRYSPSGPRILTDDDVVQGRPKVIRNPECDWTIAPAMFQPLTDVARLENLKKSLIERAGTQRGKPRSSDQGNNPLGSRVYDMACGWPMYREPVMEKGEKSFRYKCGAYTQSHGAVCEHNHIGGPLAARFVLNSIQQRLASSSLRQLVEKHLRQCAAQEREGKKEPDKRRRIAADLSVVQNDLELVTRNLAYARDPVHYDAIIPHLNRLRERESDLSQQLERLNQEVTATPDLEAELQAALGLLNRIAESAERAENHAACGELFQLVNARLFLRFQVAQWGKRTVRKPAAGVLTFGDAPAPVEIYQGKTGRVAIQAALKKAKSPHQCGGGCSVSDEKNSSLGNVSRVDWTAIELFMLGIQGWHMANDGQLRAKGET